MTAFPQGSRHHPARRSPIIAGAKNWPLAELHLESGRLDEVFRSITGGARPDERRLAVIANASSRATSRRRIAYVFIVIFLVAVGGLHVLPRRLLRARARRTSRRSSPSIRGCICSSCRRSPCGSGPRSARPGSIELLMTLPLDDCGRPWSASSSRPGSSPASRSRSRSRSGSRSTTSANPDNGVILAAYVGSFLMAGGFLAIGSCISATTKNQVIAFILSVVTCFVFLLAGLPARAATSSRAGRRSVLVDAVSSSAS